MARAWLHVDGGGPSPHELELLHLGGRFGFQAVFGRSLRAREIMAFRMIEAITAGYASRAASGDWVEWAASNGELNALLIRAQKEADADQR